ncbi:MAG TPA: hypothetical protein VN726_03280 [Hanamia sp.]|nr:hypothetical protein [Hanamia sp.]
MKQTSRNAIYVLLILLGILSAIPTFAQNTQIRGFADVLTTYEKGKASFGFDEQDLFITSELTDRISFLGESVFKFTPETPTDFSVSIERLIIKYNIKGNHNLIMGKIHSPLNYWNDTYHHGRVFFPTIERPLLFAADIIPLHTTGISLQGHDFGKLKFGYDVVIGNGLGSAPVLDNDKRKSVTLAVKMRPAKDLTIGISYYNDAVSKGANVEGKIINWKVNQNLFTGSVAYFGKKFELLTEGTFCINKTDTTGSKNTIASYLYAGYHLSNKVIPYIRVDNIEYENGEIYFNKNNITSFVAGMRYEINYLAVIKLEYEYQHSETINNANILTAQFAIGF